MNIDDEVVKYVKSEVHHQYYDYDTNCAGTTLRYLSKLFDYPIGGEQAWFASLGMHGAGRYRAQCGLVEGALMFLGMYLDLLFIPDIIQVDLNQQVIRCSL